MVELLKGYKLKVNYKVLKGAVDAAFLASSVDRFPAIEIVKAEGGGVELYATDGYRMHVIGIPASAVSFDDADYLPAGLVAAQFAKALKACKGASDVEITPKDGAFTVSGGGVSSVVDSWVPRDLAKFAATLGGDYSAPDTVQFNAEYLAEVGKAANAIGNPKTVATIVFNGTQGGDSNKASRWMFTNSTSGVTLCAYLMPVRGGK